MSKSNNFYWYTFSRDALPEALFGMAKMERTVNQELDGYKLAQGMVAVAYRSQAVLNEGRLVPALIVLGDDQQFDILSWLNTYASEAYPLSHFARVVSYSDWKRFRALPEVRLTRFLRTDRLACVSLGEILANGDGDVSLAKLPLSRATACFTSTVARAAYIYGDDSSMISCVERLRKIESDRRFAKRPLKISDLVPIWALAQAVVVDTGEALDAVGLAVHAASEYDGQTTSTKSNSSEIPAWFLEHLSKFANDSVEERVLTFRQLSTSIEVRIANSNKSALASAMLAGGAFLVGRSTSHVFLLSQYAKSRPDVYVWFSLIASLMGPRGWDPSWAKVVMGIERQLRFSFDWADPTNSDLCWTEYVWMDKAYEGVAPFLELPRYTPRAISIEVIPGTSCQLRLAGDVDTASTGSGQDSISAQEDGLSSEARSIFEAIVSIANRSRAMLDSEGRTKSGSRVKQPSLRFDEPYEYKPVLKPRRAKRDAK